MSTFAASTCSVESLPAVLRMNALRRSRIAVIVAGGVTPHPIADSGKPSADLVVVEHAAGRPRAQARPPRRRGRTHRGDARGDAGR